MECLYNANLNKHTTILTLSQTESRHTKSLRLGIGDELLITNGLGMTALCSLMEFSNEGNKVQISKFFHNLNELETDITLAVGNLDNNDRFEFIIEKAVELGVKEIVPLITEHSSNKFVRYERAVAKATAALKQSKRSILPDYSEAVRLNMLYDKWENWDSVVLADENGKNKLNIKGNKRILILCGPEGGFSEEELERIYSAPNIQKISLAASRLRSETAAIAAVSVTVFNL